MTGYAEEDLEYYVDTDFIKEYNQMKVVDENRILVNELVSTFKQHENSPEFWMMKFFAIQTCNPMEKIETLKRSGLSN